MNADETARALKWLAKETEFVFAAENLNGAAAVIESLQAQLSKLEKRIAAEGFSDLETMISKYKTVMLAANELSIETDEELEELRAQLTASHRSAQDARNELCQKCGRYREAHNGACNGCKWHKEDTANDK